MPKYLYAASYTPEGIKGLQSAGAASRVAAITDMCAALGGSLVSFDFAFGDIDAFVIVELPNDEAAAAASFAVGATGTTKLHTIKLLPLEEAEAALSRSVPYRPPGS